MGSGPHANHFGNNVRTFAIMWHTVAMFAPMIILPRAADLMGLKTLMLVGAGLLILAAALGLASDSPLALYSSLIALGFGWAMTYGAGGILIKQVVADEARFVAQGRNEFTIALMMGIGSISAGPVLHYLGWDAMNLIAILVTGILVVLIARLNLAKAP